MTTSGTATYNDYVTELVRDAYMPGGVDNPSAAQVSYGVRLLNRILKGLQTKGDFLHTVEEKKLDLTASDKDYTLDADCTEIMNVFFRKDGGDVEVVRYSREEYKELPNKTTTGKPYGYYIDMQLAAPVLYLYPVPENTTSLVSNGGNDYRCIKDHTSAAADEPGVGANTATYWELIGTAGAYTAWAASTAYKSDLIVYDQLRKIEDATYLNNTADIPAKQLDYIVSMLSSRLFPDRMDLRGIAKELEMSVFSDDSERGPMRLQVDFTG